MSATVSPPPLKRRKLTSASLPSVEQDPCVSRFRILSWNVNGLAAPSVIAFFGSTESRSSQSSKKRTPSLRDSLRRYDCHDDFLTGSPDQSGG
ncbi:hypothetical protein SMMN14_02050 [Sphaerulina musiva]